MSEIQLKPFRNIPEGLFFFRCLLFEVLAIDDAADGKIERHPNYGSESTKIVYKTVHHEAETHEETITKHVCKKCGHVKED